MVRGLAWRCCGEPVGEERLQRRRDQGHDRRRRPCGVLAGGGQREQFRGGRQIPVGGGWFAVPEVGRQRRDLGLHVLAGAIPAEQGADREGVAQVVQPGPVGRIGSDAGVVDEPPERLADHGIEQPFAGQGDEEGSDPRRAAGARRAAGRSRSAPSCCWSAEAPAGTCRTWTRGSTARHRPSRRRPRSSLIASPIRSPLAASSPIRVW